MPKRDRSGETIYSGIPVSDGVARGKVLILGRKQNDPPRRVLAETEIPQEINRLEKALVDTRIELTDVKSKVASDVGATEAGIFDAHLLVLEDRVLIDEVIRVIQDDRINAEHAYYTIATRYAEALSKVEDDYLRERAADIRDIAARVLSHLLGIKDELDPRHLSEPCIIVAHDLSPATTAQLDRKNVLGFATDIGSKTSHTAILARSLRLPAVVGLKSLSEELQNGMEVLLDGFNGVIILHPTDKTLFEYGQLVRRKASLDDKLLDIRSTPAVTLDGRRVQLAANIQNVNDTEAVKSSGAEGIGLYRTEFLFIDRETLPNEEEQYQAYLAVATALKPSPVIIRTLDLGGDKFASHMDTAPEMNPFLGWRAIRFCLHQTDIFRTQLRAILRASTEGNIKMMYPMISGIDELAKATAFLEECKTEMRREGIPFNEKMEIGAMIETPSAALVADALAKRLDFFSIGSNDLIQYTLAADRTNERVAHLYEPTHPAILKLIKMTVDAAHRNDIWVGVCGEIAGDPLIIPILVGLGVDELSLTPAMVPQIKFLIRRLKDTETRELAEYALGCESAGEILTRATALAQQAAPDLFVADDTQES